MTMGRPLECGEIGALEIKGPNVFRGYWRNPDATKSTFREDGYFITGDVARIDEEGVVTIVGREKDLIISAGFNIYPSENRIPKSIKFHWLATRQCLECLTLT